MEDQQEGYIKFGVSELFFRKYGSGKLSMLCFHGFGQNHQYFEVLAQAFPDYTLYSFDLFFHGHSRWNLQEQALSKSYWKQLLTAFLFQENIEQFALCGYSMGGKFVLASLEALPDRVSRVILIAPDGVKTSLWYSLATYPSVFRLFFRAQVMRPTLFQWLVARMEQVGIMNKGVLKFANSQMSRRSQRSRVYFTWVVFRKLKFSMPAIAHLINHHQIGFEMYLGSHDKIITSGNMQRLLRRIEHHQLHIISSGHTRLIEETARWIKAQTLD